MRYIKAALDARDCGMSAPFTTIRIADGTVIGSTRFFYLERWTWPEGHERHGHAGLNVCEIGYTWLAQSTARTVANTEVKLLMLTYASERWRLVRVCLHTDMSNVRSRASMQRMGARFDGNLHRHRMAVGFIPRDSARYSNVAQEWPNVKKRLVCLRDRA